MTRSEALQGGPLLILIGELLLVVCSISYLVWWSVVFRPSSRPAIASGPFLAGAVLGGLGGVVLLAVGSALLLPRASGLALGATVVGGVVLGAVLVWLTTTLAHRSLTTELPLIVVWTTAQVLAGVALGTSGVLSTPTAAVWLGATAVALLVGLACYLIFYSLGAVAAYRVGMVPLAVDGVVAAVLTAVLVLERAR